MKTKQGKAKLLGILIAVALTAAGTFWWLAAASSAQAQPDVSNVAKTVAAAETAQTSTNAAPATDSTSTPAAAPTPAATDSTATSTNASSVPPAAPTATTTESSTTATSSTPAATTETSSSALAPAPAPGSQLKTATTNNAPGGIEERVNPLQPSFGGIAVGSDTYYRPIEVANGASQSRLPVILGVDFQTIYDDNIYITRGSRQADVIYRTTPKIAFESTRLAKEEKNPTNPYTNKTVQAQNLYGTENDLPENYFRADYAAIYQKYNKFYTNDSLDHNADLFYRYTGDRTTFEAGQTFNTFHGPNVDVRGTLEQTDYASRLFGSYNITGKTTLELEAVYTGNQYQRLGYNTNEWVLSPYVNYEIAPKLTLGLGSIIGWLDVVGGIGETYQQPNIRAVYQYGEKLTFTARLGWEVREFDGTDSDRKTPMFAFGASWAPYEGTVFNADAYRKTVPAIGTPNQIYDDTGVKLEVRQYYRQKFFLGGWVAYDLSQYYLVPNDTSSGRTDDYITVHPYVGYKPNDMLAFTVYYQHSEDFTNVTDDGFVDNQVGFQGSFSY